MWSCQFRVSMRLVLRIFEKSPEWLYYHRHRTVRVGVIKRPDVLEAVHEGIRVRPPSYGYRRIYRYVEHWKTVACNKKTVLRYMQQNHWLSTERNRYHKKKRSHTGRVVMDAPNKRWSSDIIDIRAWNGEKGRLAMIADCGNIEILGYVCAKKINSVVMRQIIAKALKYRFGDEQVPEGIELQFLTDNGSEYIDKDLVKWMRAVGLEVCNTPVRSPQSNGMSEAVNRWIRTDYLKQHPCMSFEEIIEKIPEWIKDYNTMCPHERLGGLSAREFYEEWLAKTAK